MLPDGVTRSAEVHWYEAHGKGRFEFKIKRYVERQMMGPDFVVCISNAGYEASLDRGGRYRVLPDVEATAHHQVRIVDESGEDYLYPVSCFSSVEEPASSVLTSAPRG